MWRSDAATIITDGRNEWFAHSNRFDDFIDSYDGLNSIDITYRESRRFS